MEEQSMNKNIKVNEIDKTIGITVKFSKKATIYGSDEYKDLHRAKSENPGFKVVIVAPKRKKTKLNLDYMTRYMHDLPRSEENDRNRMVFDAFVNGLHANTKDKDGVPVTFGAITKWFVSKYPDYKDYSPIDAIIARSKNKIENHSTPDAA